jgi:hypothetical protein
MPKISRSKKTRRAASDPQARLGQDPTTIANPHARPRAGSIRPVVAGLPQVVDHRGHCPHCGVEHRVTFALQRGQAYSWDNIGVRTVWYRTEYAHGAIDEVCRYQQVIAATDAKAVEVIQRLQRGYPRIHLFGIDRPPTVQEIEASREVTAQQTKADGSA